MKRSFRELARARGCRVLGVLALALPACRFEPGPVTRVFDGVRHEGRYIAPNAYAEYARGALHEARGDLAAALAHYEAALRIDPRSPEIRARIGHLQCRRSRSSGDRAAQAARRAFAGAIAKDPRSSIAWFESARCQRKHGNLDAALAQARKAARFDPESVATSVLVAELCEARGDAPCAAAWLDALVAKNPESRPAWNAVLAHAERRRDAGRLLRARRALASLGQPPPPHVALEDAFVAGDLGAARRAAVRLRLPPGRLALRAALVGAMPIAREQAKLVLAADPDDTEAWVAALLIADLERDADAFDDLLRHPPDEPTPPSAEAVRALHELVSRRAGAESARALREATGVERP